MDDATNRVTRFASPRQYVCDLWTIGELGRRAGGIDQQLLDEIEEFQKSQKRPGDGSGFRAWLAATNEKYNRWLSSCERVDFTI